MPPHAAMAPPLNPVPAPAADDGNTELVGDAHHGLHLGGVLRKYNGVGQRMLD